MRTKRFVLIVACLLACSALAVSAGGAETVKPAAPVLNNLLRAELDGVDGVEVILSHVTIPPNTTLPKHWHPGEEFAYVLQGSATLWQEGGDDVELQAGEAVKVPLEQIHTAITGEEGVTLVVFRVHRTGEPERHPVE